MSWYLGNYGFFNNDIIAESSFCIKDLGVELRRNENYCFDNAKRDYQGYLFQYTIEGCGIYENQGTQYKLSKGKSFLITFPEDSRYFLSPSEEVTESGWKLLYIHFAGPGVELIFNRIREITGPVIDLGEDSIPVGLLYDFYSTLQSKRQLERYAGSEWLYRFLIALLRHVEAPPAGQSNPHVATAIKWMKENFMMQINLEEICPTIGVSYAHLTRLFRKEQGITPVKYITQLRLEHSIQLLLQTDQSIKIIAEQCGFASANYFSKVYKKALHITPGEYRRQHKSYALD